MITVSTSIKKPNLKVKMPENQSFWQRVALELRRKIRHRTETGKVDWRGMSFKPYSTSYAKQRIKKGRSFTPNLSFTSRMLGSMKNIATRKYGLVRLSGEDGFKAWVNEQSGRTFFRVSEKEADQIVKQVANNVAKTNNLKKR